MQMKNRSGTRFLRLILPVAAIVACDRRSSTPVPSAPMPSPATPATPAAPPVAKAAVDDSEAASTGEPTQPVVVGAGKWSENRMYRFRLDRISACGSASDTLGPARPSAAGGAGRLRGGSSWVGAFFRVEAKEPSVFVTPRDLELRRGGIILNARYIDQPLLPGCQPLVAAKSLRAGDGLEGFALFEVPRSFRTPTADPIVLSYKPTRWGGARRVEVPIRDCLDACPESSARSGKTAGRSPTRKP